MSVHAVFGFARSLSIRCVLSAAFALLSAPALATTTAADPPEIAAALASGGARIEVEVLGMVCDFCATALQKNFERRAEVGAVQVDLDTIRLTLVLAPGAALDDAAINDLVTRSGYRAAAIVREPADAPHSP